MPIRGADSISDEGFIHLESPIEELPIPMRARNALRGIGCTTIADVLRLDMTGSVRGLGRKTKQELLAALELAGFRHPMLEEQPVAEVHLLERSLKRIEDKLEIALAGVGKELHFLRRTIRKRLPAHPVRKPQL